MDPSFQRLCYGVLLADFEAQIEAQIRVHGYDCQFLAISLLSDAQEELEQGLIERARMTINRAKFLISKSRPAIREE